MDYHQNARLTIHSRELLAKTVVERGSALKATAAAFNVSAKNVGIMPLNATPPPSSGKTVWNGACIVLLAKPK
jgi:hypothetical protein